MRLALFADVHANLEALEAVLKALEPFQYDRLYVLGDTLGGGADPAACLGILSEKANLLLCGRMDRMVIGEFKDRGIPFQDAKMLGWTRRQLTDDDVSYVSGLADEYVDGETVFSHGSPQDPDAFVPITTDEMVEGLFGVRGERFIFCGSTHIPRISPMPLPGTSLQVISEPGEYEIDPFGRYYINVGSVGEPRDGDHRACAAIFDDEAYILSLIRIEYDHKKAYNKKRAMHLGL